MALELAHGRIAAFARSAGLIAAMSLGLVLGGCAQMGVPELSGSLAQTPGSGAANVAQAGGQPNASELQQATKYWGDKFTEHPRNLDNAINYAMNLKAMGRKKQALSVLQRAANFHGDSRRLASEYGRLALDLGQLKVAEKVLAMADDPADPDWRVVSAQGTVLAKQGQYAKAIPYYQRALGLAQGHPSLLNNLALSHAMNGDPQKAETILRQAVAQGAATKKVRQNLALVLGLQGKYHEATQISSRDVASTQAAFDTQAIKKMVKLAPAVSPSAGNAQIASGLKPSTQDDGSSATQGWDAQVANAQLSELRN